MDAADLLKLFKIDVWYKALLYLGGVLFAISILFDIKGLTNGQLQLLSGGMFLIGIGEWKNHKQQSWIKPPNAYTGSAAVVTQTVRKPDFVGSLFDVAGIVLVGISAWKILHHS